jgi:enoyl-CoA hydratase/carnithine racemase
MLMADEFIQVFGKLGENDEVRVIIVTGAGDIFCAGADLSGGPGAAFTESKRETADSDFRDFGAATTLSILKCGKPVIAAINGNAVGIGITMTLGMDIRIVAEDAKIAFPFSRRGIIMEACSSYFLPRIVGLGKAVEWCVTGKTFKASEEEKSGLFNYVLPRNQVLPKAKELAKEIAKFNSPISTTINKMLIVRGLQSPSSPEEAHLNESKLLNWIVKQPDAVEGVRSFLEKREPKFTVTVPKDLPPYYPWWRETSTAPNHPVTIASHL